MAAAQTVPQVSLCPLPRVLPAAMCSSPTASTDAPWGPAPWVHEGLSLGFVTSRVMRDSTSLEHRDGVSNKRAVQVGVPYARVGVLQPPAPTPLRGSAHICVCVCACMHTQLEL